jgi:CheY-like chemotaxis protein
LVISQKLVELMKGHISFESRYQEGSSFFFTINLKKSQSILKEEISFKNISVLIACYNPLVLDILSMKLEDWGLNVKKVYSSNEIIKSLRENTSIKFIILDIKDYNDIVKEIAEYNKKIPVIIYSSINQHDIKNTTILSKPIRYSILLNNIKNIFSIENTEKKLELVNLKNYNLSENIPLKILVAEDNLINQKLIIKMLNKLGYSCDIVFNGLEVLNKIKDIKYDLILMDIQMPEMDGLEASIQINKIYSKQEKPKIIALTANAMKEDRDACFESGMDDYLSKPLLINDLYNVIQKVFKS